MENRSARRSKRLIREAFADLAKEKRNIDKITVTEIAERADISKSTFYAHYDDVYSVVEEFEDEVIGAIIVALDEYFQGNNKELKPHIYKLLNMLKENDEMYRKLFKLEYNDNFIQQFKSMLKNEILRYIPQELKELNQVRFVYFFNFFLNGLTYTIVDYYRGAVGLELQDIADNAILLFSELIKYVEINKKTAKIKK